MDGHHFRYQHAYSFTVHCNYVSLFKVSKIFFTSNFQVNLIFQISQNIFKITVLTAENFPHNASMEFETIIDEK